MIFYTADLHLGYFPILHDTARPFTGVPEMDEALISNWNARVGADDSVYIVGDFSYNGGEAPTQYLSRLNGHLHLIRGNHDTGLNHAERLLDYCDSVTDFLEIDDGGTHILLCHYPILHEKGEILEALGYELSDDEEAMADGSHRLFNEYGKQVEDDGDA